MAFHIPIKNIINESSTTFSIESTRKIVISSIKKNYSNSIKSPIDIYNDKLTSVAIKVEISYILHINNNNIHSYKYLPVYLKRDGTPIYLPSGTAPTYGTPPAKPRGW